MKQPFKLLFLATVIAIISPICACNYAGEEPVIEGKTDKYFDHQAQIKSFRVLTQSGKPYNHKINWHILGLIDPRLGSTILETKVDTLSNGNLKISYDWISILVKDNKSTIVVEVLENTTGKERSILFETTTDGKQIFKPDMIIVQKSQ